MENVKGSEYFPNALYMKTIVPHSNLCEKIFPTISLSIITNPRCERAMEVIGLLLRWPIGYEFHALISLAANGSQCIFYLINLTFISTGFYH